MKLNQLRRIIKEEILREIRVNKMGNLKVDPQIQQDMDGNPDSNLEQNYKRSLLDLERLYRRVKDLESTRPISFEIGIARNYSWLPKMFIGQWVTDDGFKSEDELILIVTKDSKKLAIMGGGNSFYAVANTIDGENIIEEYGEEGEYSEDEMVEIFTAWSKLP